MEGDMSVFQALILGLIQGITEFFPISSSAHLKIAKLLFKIDETQNLASFDLMCHLGTLLAVLFFFRKKIMWILLSDRKKILYLFTALLPLIPFYFLLKPLREYASQTHLLGFSLLLTGCILFIGDRFQWKRKSNAAIQSTQWKDALWIGSLQASALIPGISRSASTISCARVLGWDVKEAVEFSFLLSIPTILGGNCLELIHFISTPSSPVPTWTCSLVGCLASMVAGSIVIRYAMKILCRGKLFIFGWYCAVLGIILIFMLNF